MLKAFFVAVDVQNAFFFKIEIYAFFLRLSKQVFSRGNGKASELYGIAFSSGMHSAFG